MSFLFFHHSVRRRLCSKAILSRYINQRTTYDGRIHISLAVDQGSFEAAGIRPAVAELLRVAFPNVEKPTAMQKKLLRAISQNRDVLLQDDTGTGKSFAVMLALLSKLPVPEGNSVGPQDGKTLAGLLIVPHRDLAYQYLHWIHRMTLSQGGTPSSLTRHTQVLVRHVDKSALQGLPICMQEAIKSSPFDQDLLLQQPPHILIATPNVFLEFIERQPEASRVLAPSAVFVDEVDALLRIPGGKLPGRGRAPRKKLERHVPDLVQILNRLHPAPGDRDRMHQVYSEKGPLAEQGHSCQASRPQLIMVSATLRSRLRDALFDTFGWLRRGEAVKLSRKRSSALPAHRLGRSAIHHVLVVSKTGGIKNIVGARPLAPDAVNDASLLEKEVEDHKDGEDAYFYDGDDDTELVGVDKTLVHAPLAFDPAVLEAVAVTFALDVPRIALLVLPATAAVRKIIFELQQLGVNAHPLDLVANEVSRAHVLSQMDEVSEENPALIVATLATIRGIDLPDLSHVFMLGVPGGRSGDAYLHVAGRVGRFGRRGRVVTIVEEGKEERVGNKVVVRDEAKMMRILFSRIGIQPSLLGHFE